ncbi:MAG TPA: hypothetical protein VF795_00825 [Desulfuromonadaceae bacterium]
MPEPVRPPTFAQLIWSDTSDLYGADPTRRVELWRDVAGVATYREILAACPGLLPWMEGQIRAEGDRRLIALASPYGDRERETWPYQRAEALAWRADNTVPTPYCDAIAGGRGVSREVFIPKVLEVSDLFTQASTAILGQQQALIDRISAATDMDTLLAIAWPQP